MNLIMDITTLTVKRGRTIKALQPNKDGIFENVPSFVIGKGSRSTDYEHQSFFNSLNGDGSIFKLKVQEGNCMGEYGHPFLSGVRVEEDIKRLFHIEMTRTSHVIHGYHTKPLDNGDYLGSIDIKPTGPYANALRESLIDNTINTSFSMRTFCHPPIKQPNGRFLKKIAQFITIDAEGTPGWEEASKRFHPTYTLDAQTTMECINKYAFPCSQFNIQDVIRQQTEIGKEAHNNQLWDLLKADAITLDSTEYIIDVSNRTLMNKDGYQENIFHKCFNRR